MQNKQKSPYTPSVTNFYITKLCLIIEKTCKLQSKTNYEQLSRILFSRGLRAVNDIAIVLRLARLDFLYHFIILIALLKLNFKLNRNTQRNHPYSVITKMTRIVTMNIYT